ncbi:MAG: hypothetical protein KZY61_11360 [Clostridiaceae bacterium]|nr:hypothetical protein [Clostridiaceae bacterium]MBW4860251.1 hypothetical protein [Clostridiaceae bacterium]MBW4869228.1 hypothetical protein [Clostridiaceae bacterium]
MNHDTIKILNQLNQEKISCKKAIKLINKKNRRVKSIKKASKMKIYVSEKNKTIRLPGIHFCFFKFLTNVGIYIANISMKKGKIEDEDTKKLLYILNEIDLNIIFNELKSYGPFDLVHIKEGEDTEIKISIL